MKKRDLTKMAVLALLAASTSLSAGELAKDESVSKQDMTLAAGCSSCSGRNKEVAYTTPSYYSNTNDAYNTSTNTYSAGSDWNTNRGTASNPNANWNAQQNRGTNAPTNTSWWGSSETPNTGTAGTPTTGTGTTSTPTNKGSWWGSSDSSGNTGAGSWWGSSDRGSSAPTYSSSADYDRSANTSMSNRRLTEADLLKQLNDSGKNMYQQLDPQGRDEAIRLASQDSYRDKNLAVKEVFNRRMGSGATGYSSGAYNTGMPSSMRNR